VTADGPPEGWYPDPWQQEPPRWWDGRRWTAVTRPLSTTGLVVPRSWLVRTFIAALVLAVVVGVAASHQVATAYGAPAHADTLSPALYALAVWAGVAFLIGVVEGWRSPEAGVGAAVVTGVIAAVSAAIATYVQVSQQPCTMPTGCDIASVPVIIPVSLVTGAALTAAVSAGWASCWFLSNRWRPRASLPAADQHGE
jgi:hypothetical protein